MRKHGSKNIEMIRLIADGYSAKEMAPMLGMSEAVCERYRHLLFQKYGARNAPHMVKIAYIQGLLTVPISARVLNNGDKLI